MNSKAKLLAILAVFAFLSFSATAQTGGIVDRTVGTIGGFVPGIGGGTDSGELRVRNVQTNGLIQRGDTLWVSTTISSSNSNAAYGDLEVQVGNNGALGSKTTSVSVETGELETTIKNFQFEDTDGYGTGEIEVTASAGDSTSSTTFTVEESEEPGDLEVSSISAPNSVEEGQELSGEVSFQNVGGSETSNDYSIRLQGSSKSTNGNIETSNSVSRSFSFNTNGLSGEKTIEAQIGDSTKTKTITIEESEEPQPEEGTVSFSQLDYLEGGKMIKNYDQDLAPDEYSTGYELYLDNQGNGNKEIEVKMVHFNYDGEPGSISSVKEIESSSLTLGEKKFRFLEEENYFESDPSSKKSHFGVKVNGDIVTESINTLEFNRDSESGPSSEIYGEEYSKFKYQAANPPFTVRKGNPDTYTNLINPLKCDVQCVLTPYSLSIDGNEIVRIERLEKANYVGIRPVTDGEEIDLSNVEPGSYKMSDPLGDSNTRVYVKPPTGNLNVEGQKLPEKQLNVQINGLAEGSYNVDITGPGIDVSESFEGSQYSTSVSADSTGQVEVQVNGQGSSWGLPQDSINVVSDTISINGPLELGWGERIELNSFERIKDHGNTIKLPNDQNVEILNYGIAGESRIVKISGGGFTGSVEKGSSTQNKNLKPENFVMHYCSGSSLTGYQIFTQKDRTDTDAVCSSSNNGENSNDEENTQGESYKFGDRIEISEGQTITIEGKSFYLSGLVGNDNDGYSGILYRPSETGSGNSGLNYLGRPESLGVQYENFNPYGYVCEIMPEERKAEIIIQQEEENQWEVCDKEPSSLRDEQDQNYEIKKYTLGEKVSLSEGEALEFGESRAYLKNIEKWENQDYWTIGGFKDFVRAEEKWNVPSEGKSSAHWFYEGEVATGTCSISESEVEIVIEKDFDQEGKSEWPEDWCNDENNNQDDENPNEEIEGEEPSITLNSESVKAGSTVLGTAFVPTSTTEQFRIIVENPQDENIWETTGSGGSDTSYEVQTERDWSEGEYTIRLKPTGGNILTNFLGTLTGSNSLASKTFTVNSGEVERWKQYCRENMESYEGIEDQINCIENQIVPNYFEDSVEENPEVAQSLCQDLLGYQYSQEERRCQP